MSLEDPVIITCSISGALANREQCPAIPYTPKEYAAEDRAVRRLEAEHGDARRGMDPLVKAWQPGRLPAQRQPQPGGW